MKIKNKQKGLTAISLLFIIVVFAFVVVSLLKIIPIYFDSFKVNDVVSSMKDERGLGDKSNKEITAMIIKRLQLNQVSGISKDDVYIEKEKNSVFIDIEYEVRKAMFGNLDVIVSFKKSVEASVI